MNTSAHLTSRSRIFPASGDLRSSARLRLLRLANWNGYGTSEFGCGGIFCPIRHISPLGGSTLTTSAPKSDKMTAALGPAMKLAKSTTFNPEKMFSLILISFYLFIGLCLFLSLSPPKLRSALFKKGRCPLLLVFGAGAQSEERSLQRQALIQAGFQSFVDRLKRMPDGDRRVGEDLFQNRFGAADQVGGGYDFIDQSDSPGLLRGDDFAGKDELQGPAFSDQTRQPLCSASAGRDSKFHFGLSEFGRLRGDPNGASHSRFTTAAEREPVDGRDHRLAQVLNQVKHGLSIAAGFLALDRRQVSEFADVCSRDECLVASPGQDNAVHLVIIAGCFERCSQVFPRLPIQRVENPRAIERHIRNGALFLVQYILQCETRLRCCCCFWWSNCWG